MSDNIVSLGADKAAIITEGAMLDIFSSVLGPTTPFEYYRAVSQALLDKDIDVKDDRYRMLNGLLTNTAEIHMSLFSTYIKRHIRSYSVVVGESLNELHVVLGPGVVLNVEVKLFEYNDDKEVIGTSIKDDTPYHPLLRCKRILDEPNALSSRILASIINRFLETAVVVDTKNAVLLINSGIGERATTRIGLMISKGHYELIFGG